MSINLTAAQCPTPQVNAVVAYLASSYNSTGPTTPGSYGINAAKSAYLSSNFNADAAYAYLVATYGGGNFGILNGLVVTAGSGLSCTISPGQYLVGGIFEFPNGFTYLGLPDNTALIWVWATNANTIQVVATSLTPPATPATLLACVTTSGGAVTNVDTSSVPSLVGAICTRQTADRCVPSDSPSPSLRIQTITQAGVFQWTGSTHQPVNSPPVFTQTITTTLSLNAGDLGLYGITPSGGNRTVELPATPVLGAPLTIYNPAAPGGHNLILTDSTGTRTVATLTPGQVANLGNAIPNASGIPSYPVSVTPTGGYSQVLFDATSAGNGSAVTSITVSHTNAGNMLIVSVVELNSVIHVSGITYNGVAMTAAGPATLGTTLSCVQYYLASPATGAHNIVVSFSTTIVGAQVFGVSATGAAGTIGNVGADEATGNAASVSIVGAAGDLVVDVVGCGGAATLTSTQTQRNSGTVSTTNCATSTAPGANPVVMGYSLSASVPFVMASLVIQA